MHRASSWTNVTANHTTKGQPEISHLTCPKNPTEEAPGCPSINMYLTESFCIFWGFSISNEGHLLEREKEKKWQTTTTLRQKQNYLEQLQS